MCYKHGKLIDTDETRFTIDILNYWKTLAEDIANYMHENSVDYSHALSHKINSPLAKISVTFESLENENETIGDALFDSCIQISWGENLMNSTRDFLIELTRNAFIHGESSFVKIDIEHQKITIIDKGNIFDIYSLLNNKKGRGGKLAYKYLLDNYSDSLIITSIRESNFNKIIISLIKTPQEIFDISPCAISITRLEFKYGLRKYSIPSNCQELFIVLPKYITLSDVFRIGENALENERRPVVFLGENLSKYSIEMIKEKYPKSKIVNLK